MEALRKCFEKISVQNQLYSALAATGAGFLSCHIFFMILFLVCFLLVAGVLADSSYKSSSALFGNGVNLQPSYYNNGDVEFGWSVMKEYSKIKTVRIEIEPDKVTQGQSWIAEAHANGYTVIATYHKYTVLGSDDPNEVQEAADWWLTNYKTLSSSGDIIINMMNEWGSHDMTPATYAAAYNSAISTVRQVYSGYIILDCAGWGQETATSVAAVKGTNGATPITDDKIILSVHAYPNGYNAGLGHTLQASDLDNLATAGTLCIIGKAITLFLLPLVLICALTVGEFGSEPSSGPSDWQGIAKHATSLGWSILGWAWNGDGGSVMNMVTPSWASNATATSFEVNDYFALIYPLL